MQEQLPEGKQRRTLRAFSYFLSFHLTCLCVAFRVTGWCKLKDFPPFPFSEQLIGKLTSDVHLHLSSLIHLNSGKISTTEQLAMLLTQRWRLKKARKGTETQVFIVSKKLYKSEEKSN